MGRQFQVVIPDKLSIPDTIRSLKSAADSFDGDMNNGNFEKSGVKGSYFIDGRTATIKLTDKPFLVSWDYVQGKIENYFK